jgi:hypothetical protein
MGTSAALTRDIARAADVRSGDANKANLSRVGSVVAPLTTATTLKPSDLATIAQQELGHTRHQLRALQHRVERGHLETMESSARDGVIRHGEAEGWAAIEAAFRAAVVDLAEDALSRLHAAEHKATRYGKGASGLRKILLADTPLHPGTQLSSVSGRQSPALSAADSTEWSESAQGLAAEQEAVRTLQSYLKDARAATAQALQQLAERDATIDRLQTQLASVEALKTKSDSTSRDVMGRVQKVEESARLDLQILRRQQVEAIASFERQIAGLVGQVAAADRESRRCQAEVTALFEKRQIADAALSAEHAAALDQRLRQQAATYDARLAKEARRTAKANDAVARLTQKVLYLERINNETCVSRGIVLQELTSTAREKNEVAVEAARRVETAERLRDRIELDHRRQEAELQAVVAEKDRVIGYLHAQLDAQKHQQEGATGTAARHRVVSSSPPPTPPSAFTTLSSQASPRVGTCPATGDDASALVANAASDAAGIARRVHTVYPGPARDVRVPAAAAVGEQPFRDCAERWLARQRCGGARGDYSAAVAVPAR